MTRHISCVSEGGVCESLQGRLPFLSTVKTLDVGPIWDSNPGQLSASKPALQGQRPIPYLGFGEGKIVLGINVNNIEWWLGQPRCKGGIGVTRPLRPCRQINFRFGPEVVPKISNLRTFPLFIVRHFSLRQTKSCFPGSVHFQGNRHRRKKISLSDNVLATATGKKRKAKVQFASTVNTPCPLSDNTGSQWNVFNCDKSFRLLDLGL